MRFLRWARCLMYTLFLNASTKYRGADGIKTTPPPEDCIYKDFHGNKYNITTITNSNGHPRFEASDTPDDPDKGYKYFFNPCINFTLDDCQSDVAICRCHGKFCRRIGTQQSVQFDLVSEIPALHYSSDDVWKSTVLLKCDLNDEEGTFRVWEDIYADNVVLNLTHKCACPNVCLISPSKPTSKETTATPSGQTDNIVSEVVPSVGGGVVLIVIAIVIWHRRKRRNDQYPPLLDDNRDAVDDVSENHFPDVSEGSELTSGRGSASFRSLAKPPSSGSSCNEIKVTNKKDDLYSNIKKYQEVSC